MVQKGFAGTVAKSDLEELRKAMQEGFLYVSRELADVKRTLPPLLRAVAAMEVDTQELKQRVYRLEKKVGLVK